MGAVKLLVVFTCPACGAAVQRESESTEVAGLPMPIEVPACGCGHEMQLLTGYEVPGEWCLTHSSLSSG